MEDASLEDFLDGSDSSSGATDGEEAGGETGDEGTATEEGENGSDERVASGRPPAAVERPSEGDGTAAIGTYEFTPAGAPCADCGDGVQRRWRDEAGLVCAACKSW